MENLALSSQISSTTTLAWAWWGWSASSVTLGHYCITPVLDEYPSHLDRITHIQMITQYMQHSLLQSMASLLPSITIYFHLTICFCPIASIQADLLVGHIIGSFPQVQPSSTCLMTSAWSVVTITMESRCGMRWKGRQWEDKRRQGATQRQ